MSSAAALLLLALGLGLVVAGAEIFLDGLLASASRLGVSAFAVTVVLSGFELENLAAGIAANAKGLDGAAAGTFLGGTTFLAIGVAGLAALIAPIRSRLPGRALTWTAVSPLPLLALGLDGTLSRLDGALLVVWFGVALVGLVRAGRDLLEPEAPQRRRHAFAWLLGGLAVLTAGGVLLAEGIRGAVERLGASQTLLGNTVVAASVEAEEVEVLSVRRSDNNKPSLFSTRRVCSRAGATRSAPRPGHQRCDPDRHSRASARLLLRRALHGSGGRARPDQQTLPVPAIPQQSCVGLRGDLRQDQVGRSSGHRLSHR